ncbi:accessory gene regulator B family protein [Paenibacillus algorifonticola]|uniref:accessory gene regulator B family protein n=1 Tax=Paenibacillus algorifonticola TaxID=684063 RepID=UPI003D2C7B49
MIEFISRKMALFIKRFDPKGDVSVEVMAFSLGNRICSATIIVFTLLIGIATESFIPSLIGLVAFWTLRKFTGGFHFKSLTTCVVVSTFLLSIIPHIVLSGMVMIILILLSLTLLICWSRGSDRNIPLLLILSNIFFQSDVVALAFFAQMVLVIIHQREGGVEYDAKTSA